MVPEPKQEVQHAEDVEVNQSGPGFSGRTTGGQDAGVKVHEDAEDSVCLSSSDWLSSVSHTCEVQPLSHLLDADTPFLACFQVPVSLKDHGGRLRCSARPAVISCERHAAVSNAHIMNSSRGRTSSRHQYTSGRSSWTRLSVLKLRWWLRSLSTLNESALIFRTCFHNKRTFKGKKQKKISRIKSELSEKKVFLRWNGVIRGMF